MTQIRPEYIQLRDPLSEVARKERRNLLIISAIGIVVVKTGLIPTKISALGIEFSQTDRHSLLFTIAAVVIYCLIAFSIYSWSDLLAWKITYYHAFIAHQLETKASEDLGPLEFISWRQFKTNKMPIKKADEKTTRIVIRPFWYSLYQPVTFLRAIFEFLAPLLIGLYAIYILLQARV